MCQDQFQPGLHFVRVRALHSSPCIQFRLCNSEPEEPSSFPSLVRPIPPPPPDTVRRYLCRLRFPAKCTSIIFMFAVHFTILVPGSFLENRFLPSSVGVPTGGTVTGIRQQQQRKDSRGHSGARAELGLGEVWFILIIFFFNLKSITDQFYQLFYIFFKLFGNRLMSLLKVISIANFTVKKPFPRKCFFQELNIPHLYLPP